MLPVMFQGDRCWRKSPADFGQAGGHEKLFPAFPEAKDSKEAFSEERGSASSYSLHIFTASLGSKPLRPARTVDKQSSNTFCGFQAPGFLLFSPLCHHLLHSTEEIIPISPIYISAALLFFHPLSKADKQMKSSEGFSDLDQGFLG